MPHIGKRIVFALAAVFLSWPAALHACSCSGRAPVCQAAPVSAAVFVGRAVGHSVINEPVKFGDRTAYAEKNKFTFAVSENFIGPHARTISIVTGTGGGDCGIGFAQGQEYLVYAWRESDGTLSTGICSRTAPVSNASEDLAYLRNPAASPAPKIYGVITESTPGFRQRPLARVPVILESGGRSKRTTSGPEGTYVFDDLFAGTFTLRAEMPRGLGGGERQTITLKEHACAQTDFLAVHRAQLGGKLNAAKAEYLGSTKIEMIPLNSTDHADIASTFSGENGDFTIRGLPPGDYLLGVSIGTPPGSITSGMYPPTYFPGVPNRAAAQVIHVGTAQQLTGFVLPLPSRLRQRTITGRITWPNGTPAEEAHVELTDHEFPDHQASGAPAGRDGTFRIEAVQTRSYTAVAVSGFGVDALRSQPARLGAANNGPLTLVLPQPPTIDKPAQLSPAEGAVFSQSDRSTTLKWSAVPGARYYGIETDCGESNRGSTAISWGSEHGLGSPCSQSFMYGPTTYTFNFIGAQPGRWRVWAVGQFGQKSPKTPWRQFRHTR